MINNYQTVLSQLKEKIRAAKSKAALAVNAQLLGIYWEIGNTIHLQEKEAGWGTKIVETLGTDLRIEFPDMRGFSLRNLRYMRDFSIAYPQFLILQLAIANSDITITDEASILQRNIAKLPWGHNCTILDKLKTLNERLFYAQKAVENGWGRDILVAQIKSGLQQRLGNTINNFEGTLPKPQSDLARETLKNRYLFDFLSIGEEIQERELEKALIKHLKKFMLELGRGFAYVGNQYNLLVEDDDYFLDLLFYNYHLKCFVLFELKVGSFKPEYTGKLNFYINTVDEQLKGNEHNPTIGVLLCKTPNDTVVKYALKGIVTPMGIAEYELTNALPQQLKGEIPSIEELELELDKEIIVPKKPIEEKKQKLYDFINKLKGEEVKKEKNREVITQLFNDVILRLKEMVEKLLEPEIELFSDGYIAWSINESSNRYFTAIDFETAIFQHENIYRLGLYTYLDGFKKAGTKAFNISRTLDFELHKYKYQYNLDTTNRGELVEKLYHEVWSEEELEFVAEKWAGVIIDEINRNLENC